MISTNWGMAPAILALAGCMSAVSSRAELDCEEREAAYRDPDLSSCVRASDFAETCIAAAAFDDGSDCLVLDASAVLCTEDRSFDMEVFLSTDRVTLDCGGQVIEHDPGRRKRSGIRAPYEHSVADVTVANCSIRNTGRYGVDLKRFFRGAELDGPMTGHERILLRGLSIADSAQVGIYVGQNSREVTIEDSDIAYAHTGIYLEAGSRSSVVRNVSITGSREGAGIHIDSSMDNVVEQSHFENNREGAILLYKNCGERQGQVCPIRRPLGASGNTIRYNELDGDISVAHRQFKTYVGGWCAGIDVLGSWRDHAENNRIHDNEVHAGSQILIRDAPNEVASNRFYASILSIGVSAPVGDDPIQFSGVIDSNVFDESSWIAVEGDRQMALAKMRITDNRDGDGVCYADYRQRVSCNNESHLVELEVDEGCYGKVRAIDGAVCSME